MAIKWVRCQSCGEDVEIAGAATYDAMVFCLPCYSKRAEKYGNDAKSEYDHYDEKHNWVKGTGRRPSYN
jgi:hypothetical protein